MDKNIYKIGIRFIPTASFPLFFGLASQKGIAENQKFHFKLLINNCGDEDIHGIYFDELYLKHIDSKIQRSIKVNCKPFDLKVKESVELPEKELILELSGLWRIVCKLSTTSDKKEIHYYQFVPLTNKFHKLSENTNWQDVFKVVNRFESHQVQVNYLMFAFVIGTLLYGFFTSILIGVQTAKQFDQYYYLDPLHYHLIVIIFSIFPLIAVMLILKLIVSNKTVFK